MRFATSLCFGVIAAAVLAGPARPQDGDDWLRLFAVHINRTPKQPWTGYGVYLGRGIVVTAAHVAGLGIWRKPRVEIGGENLPTVVVKDGHFHRVDLSILHVDERVLPVNLGLRRMPLCEKSPWAGEPVLVVTPEGVTRSQVMSPARLPPGIPAEFRMAIRFVPASGASGSGVFDANKKCLLGIITRQISRDEVTQKDGHPVIRPLPVAKYFIPAAKIADFIPAAVRF
jgi:hypothetical protein